MKISYPAPRERITPTVADLSQGLGTLSRLASSRLPMDRLMEVYAQVAPATWQPAIPGMRAAIRSGRSLVGGFDDTGIVLPADVRGVIQAGEASGSLASGLRAAADLAARRNELRTNVANALAYPAFLAVVGAGAVGMLILIVIPRFATLFGDMGVPLPATTQGLLDASTWIRERGWALATVGGLATVSFAVALRLPASRQHVDQIILSLPIIGSITLREITSRICTTVSAQLSAGIPLASALRTAQLVVGNTALKARLERARASIVAGTSPARALSEERALTEVAISYIRAGESSGTLAEMLREAAGLEEARLRSSLNRLVRLLEPTMVLALGGAIALVAAALLQAMYTVRAGNIS
jgi:general secretion pathway protein F